MGAQEKDQKNQLAFALFPAMTATPNGDGSYTLKPGKPLLYVTPKQLADMFRVTRSSVYRWIEEGLIDQKHVKLAGFRKMLISAEAVPSLQKKFESKRSL